MQMRGDDPERNEQVHGLTFEKNETPYKIHDARDNAPLVYNGDLGCPWRGCHRCLATRVPSRIMRVTSVDGMRTSRPTCTIVTFSSRIQRRTHDVFTRIVAANSGMVSSSC